jgi:hypothetical protein
VPRVESFAVELAVVAASLARLHALEITFFPPGIAEAIRDVIEQQPHQHQVLNACNAPLLHCMPSTLGWGQHTLNVARLTARWRCLA